MEDKAPVAPINSLSVNLKPNICYFGSVNDRGISKTFGIYQEDRRRHLYILGKTGMGKTTLLENMALQDIYNGYGICFIDPHGDSAEYILDRIPPFRQNDVVYFNPSDTDFPVGFNMLEAKRGEESFLIASGMMAVFNRIWAGMWSSRMEYILNNTLLALLETPGNTLLGVVRMLTDKDFRNKIIRNVQDPMVKNFWLKEFASFNDKYRTEAIAPVLNKIGQFFSTDLIRNILGQTKSTIDIREIMDKKRILIVNLSKGRLGEDNSELLGSLLVTKIQLAAMSRVDIPENERNDFYLYVDEFQNFTTDSFASILSEARKYRLNLILAHQYISQLSESGNEKVRNAIFGNVGTMISFRIGSEDAKKMELEFEPVFQTQQLINLNKTQIALKLSIDGKATDPFLANTLPPIFEKMSGRAEIVQAMSRERYSIPKMVIKEKISRWLSEETESDEESSEAKQLPGQKPKPATTQQPAPIVNSPQSQPPSAPSSTPAPAKKKKKKKINPFLLGTKEERGEEGAKNQEPALANNSIELPAQENVERQLPIQTSAINQHLQKLSQLRAKPSNASSEPNKNELKPGGKILRSTPGLKQEEGVFEVP
jgi:Type IV secretion-system coupling protein DNA-binding domain